MVRVAVAGSGAVCDVLVNGRWPRKLSGDELSAAVRQAVAEATTARLVALGEAVAGAPEGQVNASADSLGELASVRAGQRWTGYSRGGRVAVTLSGAGEVVDVEYDQRWLAAAAAVVIGSATCQAFAVAYELAKRHGLEDVIAAGETDEEIRRLWHLRDP